MSSSLLVWFCFCHPQKPTTLDMLDALHCFVLVLCCFSFFLLRFLKRIYVFVMGINAGMGMPWRGCEGQRRAWVLILDVHFVSDRLCSFSATHTRPAVSTSCHPRRALIFQVLSLCAWLLLMGLQIHSGSHASTFTTELFPARPSLCETGSQDPTLALNSLCSPFNTPLTSFSIFLAFKHILLFSALN